MNVLLVARCPRQHSMGIQNKTWFILGSMFGAWGGYFGHCLVFVSYCFPWLLLGIIMFEGFRVNLGVLWKHFGYFGETRGFCNVLYPSTVCSSKTCSVCFPHCRFRASFFVLVVVYLTLCGSMFTLARFSGTYASVLIEVSGLPPLTCDFQQFTLNWS